MCRPCEITHQFETVSSPESPGQGNATHRPYWLQPASIMTKSPCEPITWNWKVVSSSKVKSRLRFSPERAMTLSPVSTRRIKSANSLRKVMPPPTVKLAVVPADTVHSPPRKTTFVPSGKLNERLMDSMPHSSPKSDDTRLPPVTCGDTATTASVGVAAAAGATDCEPGAGMPVNAEQPSVT